MASFLEVLDHEPPQGWRLSLAPTWRPGLEPVRRRVVEGAVPAG